MFLQASMRSSIGVDWNELILKWRSRDRIKQIGIKKRRRRRRRRGRRAGELKKKKKKIFRRRWRCRRCCWMLLTGESKSCFPASFRDSRVRIINQVRPSSWLLWHNTHRAGEKEREREGNAYPHPPTEEGVTQRRRRERRRGHFQ